MVSGDGKNSTNPAPPELLDFFTQAPVPLAILSGPEFVYVSVNAPYEKLVGREVQGKRILDVFTREEVGDFIDRLDGVYRTGEPYVGKRMPLTLPDEAGWPQLRYLNVGYYPLRNAEGKIHGITAIHSDVTEEVRLAEAMARAKDLVENERANFRNLFRQTPEMVCILGGPEHVFEFVNEAHIRALGFDATGMAVREAQPESVEVHGILDDVYRTGVTAELHEIPVTLTDRVRFFNLTYAARRDSFGKIVGVMILGAEVTSEVETRERMRSSETYFREMVDESPAVIWITDIEGRCVYLSRRWYEMTGGTPETDLGFGWTEQVHSDERAEAGREFMKAVQARGPFNVRYRLRHRNGSHRWAVDSGLPRFGKSGEFLGHIGTVIDIHDQVASEGLLREVQRRFDKSAAATGLGVWYCDLPFDELIWNRETKEHFFIAPDARVTIKDFYDRIHPQDRERTRLAIQYSIDTRSAYDIHYRTVSPSSPANFKWIRAIGWTDYDAAGHPIRFDGITLDVTAEKRREEELGAAKDEAERANQLKSAFLANMSHEIRTPLGAVLGFSELLANDEIAGEEKRNVTAVIKRNGRVLSDIINDILDLSKVEAGKLDVEKVSVPFNEVLKELGTVLSLEARAKGIELKVATGADVPKTIQTDPLRLRQILLNIVGNAIKFTKQGAVTVTVGREEGKVAFVVADTGEGIPPDRIDRLFTPFTQADVSMTRRFGGTGLGLVLSRKLAQVLGGDVRLRETIPGQGSTFVITIDPGGAPVAAPVIAEPAAVRPAGARAGGGRLDELRVLVVDDSEDNQELVSTVLAMAGARVATAGNGAEAVDCARGGAFDVILMDLQMPLMDGYEATRRLRADGTKTPIIALTAHAMEEERQRTLRSGFDGHLTKPLDRELLIRTLAELTG